MRIHTSSMFWSFRFGIVLCAALTLAAAPREAAITQAQGHAGPDAPAFRGQPGPVESGSALRRAIRRLRSDVHAHGPALTLAGSHRVDISLLNSNPAPRHRSHRQAAQRAPTIS